MFKKVFVTVMAVSFAASFLLGASDNKAIATIAADKAVKEATLDKVETTNVNAVSAELQASLTKSLANKLDIDASAINRSGIPGLFEVISDQGIFYVNVDATYLLQGSLYHVGEGSVVDLTEKSMSEIRVNAIAKFADDMIVYPAKNEKYSITVFTDINCGYCRKLHREMSDYNDLGITVKYLAFPRSGISSKTYKDMVSIWCADDKAAAMSRAKEGRSIASKSCENTVKEQYELGRKLGVTGTPALVLADGSMQPGYLPADRLVSILKNVANK